VWWKLQQLVHYKFTDESALKEFLKSFNIWQNYGQESGMPKRCVRLTER